MKKLRKNKKFVLGASVALTAMMLAAATFAWYSAKDRVDNEFQSGGIPDGTVKIVELFDEEKAKEALPGTKIQKEVLVQNDGEVPVFVRATFDEKFKKLIGTESAPTVVPSATKLTDTEVKEQNKMAVPSIDYSTNSNYSDPTSLELTIKGLNDDIKAYAKELALDSGEKQYTLAFATTDSKMVDVEYTFDQATKTFTVTSQTYSYYEYSEEKTASWPTVKPTVKDRFTLDPVIKLNYNEANFAAEAANASNKWIFNAADGYFYYIGVVEGGQSTPYMLSSVEIDGTIANNSYQYMEYVLTVNAEALQATPEALSDWSLQSGNAIYDALAKLAPTI